MNRKITRSFLAALLAGAFVAGSALAGTVENVLVTKIDSTTTLKLEDGITVKVQPSTDIRNEEGDRISFADIPDPVETDATVMLRIDGPAVSGSIRATKVVVHRILRN